MEHSDDLRSAVDELVALEDESSIYHEFVDGSICGDGAFIWLSCLMFWQEEGWIIKV